MDVEQEGVGAQLAGARDRVAPRADGGDDDVAERDEQVGERLARVAVVLGEEDADGREWGTAVAGGVHERIGSRPGGDGPGVAVRPDGTA